MGDLPNVDNEYGGDKRNNISVAGIVKLIEARRYADSMSVRSEKKIDSSKTNAVLTSKLGVPSCPSEEQKQQSGVFLKESSDGFIGRLIEAVPRNPRHHKIVSVPRAELSTSFVGKLDSVEIEVDPKSTSRPSDYWESFLKHRVGPVTGITPLDPRSNIGHNCVRFVCMSDTHNRINLFNLHDFLGRVPAGDVLLHTGDFTLHGVDLQEYKDFNNLLGLLPHKIKLAIPGNHEVYLDPRLYSSNDKHLRRSLGMPVTPRADDPTEHIGYLKSVISNAKVLIDEMVEFCGIKIYGLPWVPLYGLFGFGLERGYTLLEKYNQIPAGIDILMSHGPALGFCDISHTGLHVGCTELLNSVRLRIKPKYVVHGHIHEAYGVQSDGRTTFINASICDKAYKPNNDPIVFDFPLPPPFTREDFLKLSLGDLQLSSWSD